MTRTRWIPMLAAAATLAIAVPKVASSAPPAVPAAKRPAVSKSLAPSTTAGQPAPQRSAPGTRAETAAPAPASSGTRDGMTLKGGEEGTVFRTLTIEGEDRIHIAVERPSLRLALDPERAPGLDWGTARDVLDRTTPDLVAPLLASSARDASPYVAHPWLDRFSQGAVARFRPAVTGVERWKLTVVNARGEAVATYSGKGEPPREIEWNGRSASGATAMPGVTYSYVFEAFDRAGNRRNIVGDGFRVSSFRFEGSDGPALVFAARELSAGTAGPAVTPPIVVEAATVLNQSALVARPVRVEVTSRSLEEAQTLASRVTRWLTPMVLGDPSRIQGVTLVQADAPEGGVVRIAAAR